MFGASFMSCPLVACSGISDVRPALRAGTPRGRTTFRGAPGWRPSIGHEADSILGRLLRKRCCAPRRDIPSVRDPRSCATVVLEGRRDGHRLNARRSQRSLRPRRRRPRTRRIRRDELASAAASSERARPSDRDMRTSSSVGAPLLMSRRVSQGCHRYAVAKANNMTDERGDTE